MTAGDNTANASNRHYWVILVLVSLLTLIESLDSTIVNISLLDIGKEFGVGQEYTSWIVIAYMIPMVGLIVLFGKLFQNRSLKKILLIGVVTFAVSSALCGSCRTIEPMILWRFVQGLSAAIIASATPVLIVRELPEDKISIGMAAMAIFTGVATTLGPTLGAIITSNFSWNWIFYINIPLCAILLAIVLFLFKPSNAEIENKPMPETSVCICYVIAATTFVYVISSMESGIAWYDVAMFAISVIAGVIVYRKCVNNTGERALFSDTLMHNREVLLTTISFLCTTVTASLITYLLPFYLRQAANVDPQSVGSFFLASSLITIVCSVIAGKWCQVKGCKDLTVVAIVCRIIFASIFMVLTPDMGLIPVFIALGFMGVSFGFSGTSQPTRIVQHAGPKDKEDASNIMLTGNYMGATLGVALCIIVMFITVPGAYETPVKDFTAQMITDSLHYCSIFSIVVNLIALFCTLKVRNIIPGHTEDKVNQ